MAGEDMTHHGWTAPQEVNGIPGCWSSSYSATSSRVRVYADGRVETDGHIPIDVMLKIIMAFNPKFVTTTRNKERAKFLTDCAEMIALAWEEMASVFAMQKRAPGRNEVASLQRTAAAEAQNR
jgi:hypothetical protein